ncbi:unnamed protein product [Urochloa decumbens]|uniref:KIB1-4 beta-propeller domain-containing protein n=1 Tax=Urochloa decumbens TaxID=240449 RepID=A0ABC9CIX1_9POAL
MVLHEDQEKEDGSSCFPPGFRTTAAYAVQFSDVEGRRNPTLVDPCNDSVHEIPNSGVIDAMRGNKRCVACTGTNWFLVLDEVTRECFLTTLFTTAPPPSEESVAVVPLPPMPPEDPPKQLDFLFNCALSAPSPTAPAAGCVVVLGLAGETYLRYCRLGDDAWSQLDVTFDDYAFFDGAVACHGGRIYATTTGSYSVVVDATAAPAPAARRVKIPGPFPSNHPTRPYLVGTDDGGAGAGDLYFVRPYFFGFPEEVVGVDVCRWDPSRGAWRQVDGIGDVTLFVGRNSVAVSPATEAGTEPNTVHVLRSRHDGVRIFTFSMDDMTIRCTFVGIDEDCDEYDDDETTPAPETSAYWSLPSDGRFKFELPRQGGSQGDGQEKSISRPDPTTSECPPQWSSLPTDLLANHVVPKLSFIDFLHLKSVCKDWSGISTPIRDTKACPLLVAPAKPSGGSLDIFDPVTKNKYTLSVHVPSVTAPDDSASLMLHCSKDGWLLVSRGHYSFFLMNPFKRGDDAIVALPPVHDLFYFKGISFCSTPGSHDFMVMIVEALQDYDIVTVRTWRPGQVSWGQQTDFDCEVRFRLATHNPLFLDGEFYCLARDGKLGALDPKTMAWRVLDVLEPIVPESFATGKEGLSAFLAEWKGEVVVVLRYTDVEDPIDIFRLDRERMAWSKVEELEDGAVFWDRKQVSLRPSWSLAQSFSCNKLYEPTFTETDDGVRECIFYSLDTKEYSNGSYSLYGLKEPINALWFQPNLDDC